MSNKEQFLITCRFPEWGDTKQYPAFGVRYLLTTPIIVEPDWPESDERWISYDEAQPVVEYFKQGFKSRIGKDFDGEVLFVEPFQVTALEATASVGGS